MKFGVLFYIVVTIKLEVIDGIFPEKINKIIRKRKLRKPKNCSIHRSAIVRKVLEGSFYPIYEKYGFQVPKKCKLHQSRDIFTWIEGNKTDEGIAMKCEICGKQFYKQHHLYEHAKRKHTDVFLTGGNAVCLGDYCDMFRCDFHKRYPYDIPESISCNEKDVSNLRRKCEAMTRSCLPDQMRHVIYDKVYTSLCSTLTCEKYLHPFKESISLWMVISLGIFIPVAVFIAFNLFLLWWENGEDHTENDKFIKAKRAEYRERNAAFDNRYYAIKHSSNKLRNRNKNNGVNVNQYDQWQPHQARTFNYTPDGRIGVPSGGIGAIDASKLQKSTFITLDN
eukprot:gene19163-21083_t